MSCKCGRLGALGVDPVTASIIVSLIVTGIQMGLSFWSATKAAKDQLQLQRELLDSEIRAVALGMTNLYPVLSYNDWYSIISFEFRSGYVPPELIPPKPTDGTGDQPEDTTYLWIGACAILAIALMKGRI